MVGGVSSRKGRRCESVHDPLVEDRYKDVDDTPTNKEQETRDNTQL